MFDHNKDYDPICKGAMYGVRSILGTCDHLGISKDDIVQQVLMEAWRISSAISFPFAFGYRRACFRVLDVFREKAKAKEVSTSNSSIEETLYSKKCSAERRLFTDELIESIRNTVCEEDWFILKFRSEGKTYGEIGNRLKKASTTIGVRHRKLLNRLKEEFGDDYQDA